MNKVPRITASRMVQLLREARIPPPQLPAHLRLRPGDEGLWRDALDCKGAVDWRPHELPLAAQFARAMADFQRESDLLDREPKVIRSARGQPMQNPRVKVVESISARARALGRQLRIRHGAPPF